MNTSVVQLGTLPIRTRECFLSLKETREGEHRRVRGACRIDGLLVDLRRSGGGTVESRSRELERLADVGP
jgi:hypothetical protein